VFQRRLSVGVVTLVAALFAAAPSAALACDGADAVPAPGSLASARHATLCLLNEQRTSHGLGPLTESSTLEKAADKYAADMVARRFFDHVSPGGGTFMDRIKAAGWVASGSWTAGENIAWGSGSLGTPASIVDGWMHSAGHRANILNGAFTQTGIGIAEGAPQAGVDDAGTYVNEFTGGSAKKRAKRASRPSTRAARR
jgi:uncharacterized protein YkwD